MGHDDPRNPNHHHEHHAPNAAHEVDPVLEAPRAPSVPAPARGRVAHTDQAPRPVLPRGVGVGGVLHIDCFSGIAGDMLVGALLDLGVPREPIEEALETLPVAGYRVGATTRIVSSIAATKFMVEVDEGQPYRTYRDIRAMLERAALGDGVKVRALEAFRVLALAEGRVHRIAPEDVHFHEVGGVDAIVDIVAASVGLDWLGARVSCAPLPMGRGFARTEHGIIPLPAPAVVELLAGIPTESASLDVELVTPTGAALVKANATEFTRWPSMRPTVTGFGSGTRTLPDRPNLVRLVLGESVASPRRTPRSADEPSAFAVLEANVDDATGEAIAHVTDALLREGALDAWTVAIGMKKGRPGVLIAALASAEDTERLARLMLAESTTLGVRIRPTARLERPRRIVPVETAYGRVDLKVADGDGLPPLAKPEDDQVHALARQHGVPARVVHAAAVAAYWSVAAPGARG